MMECTSHLAGLWIKVDGSVAIISIKNFPISLHVMYLYFQDMPHIIKLDLREMVGLQLTVIQYSYLLCCFLTVNRFGLCKREFLEPMDKCSLIPEGRVLVHAKVRTFQ
jgi:hypothetical protein